MTNFIQLLFDDSISQKIRLAEKTNSIDSLKQLMYDEDYLVRLAVVKNTNATKEILEYLIYDKYGSIRYQVAKHLNSTKEMWERLLEEGLNVRPGLARNPNLTIEFVKKHMDKFKLEWFGSNPNKELFEEVKSLYETFGEVL